MMGESALARQSLLKAYQLRNRASDAERFYIETLYDRDFTGNLERERGDVGNVGRELPARSRASRIARRFRPEEHRQIRAGDRRSREASGYGSRRRLRTSRASKAFSELYLNRLDDAEATVRRAEERKLASDYFLVRYFIAFVRGDGEGMRQQAAIARASRSTEDMISHLEALRLARSAQLQDARRTAAIAVAIAKQSGRLERAALVRSGHRRVGSVLRESGRRQAERHHGPRARQGPRGGLCRRVRARRLR